MKALPDDVASALVRGIATFITDTPPQELPASLRRYRNLRPQALKPHRRAILGALEDDVMRARIVEWLDRDKPSLPRREAELLRIAAERKGGYEDALGSKSRKTPAATPAGKDVGARLDAERDKTRKAKEEARRARTEARDQVRAEREKSAGLAAEVANLKHRATDAERALQTSSRDAARTEARLERELRKARAAVERAQEQRDDAIDRRKEARDEAAALRREVTSLKNRIGVLERRLQGQARKGADVVSTEREPLPVPKGRLEDDPETLREWLRTPRVRLLIDGYNVAKAEGGFGKLSLEEQRDRLIQAAGKLARSTGAATLIVFDGSKVPGGVSRVARGPAKVEYSRPGEIADDHIVARLEELPGDPVVLVTNDRELQSRGRALGATVATAAQLLALIR